MAIIAMNRAELEESNSGQNGMGNSYAGIASIIAYSEGSPGAGILRSRATRGIPQWSSLKESLPLRRTTRDFKDPDETNGVDQR
jgi:hypothetical protein